MVAEARSPRREKGQIHAIVVLVPVTETACQPPIEAIKLVLDSGVLQAGTPRENVILVGTKADRGGKRPWENAFVHGKRGFFASWPENVKRRYCFTSAEPDDDMLAKPGTHDTKQLVSMLLEIPLSPIKHKEFTEEVLQRLFEKLMSKTEFEDGELHQLFAAFKKEKAARLLLEEKCNAQGKDAKEKLKRKKNDLENEMKKLQMKPARTNEDEKKLEDVGKERDYLKQLERKDGKRVKQEDLLKFYAAKDWPLPPIVRVPNLKYQLLNEANERSDFCLDRLIATGFERKGRKLKTDAGAPSPTRGAANQVAAVQPRPSGRAPKGKK